MSGYGLDEEFHLSTILERSLKVKGFNVKVINASVSGDTTSGGLNRLNWLLKGKDVDIVILCLGANDMLRGIDPSLVRQNLEKILEILNRKKDYCSFCRYDISGGIWKKYKKEFIKYILILLKIQSFYIPFYYMVWHLIQN